MVCLGWVLGGVLAHGCVPPLRASGGGLLVAVLPQPLPNSPACHAVSMSERRAELVHQVELMTESCRTCEGVEGADSR